MKFLPGWPRFYCQFPQTLLMRNSDVIHLQLRPLSLGTRLCASVTESCTSRCDLVGGPCCKMDQPRSCPTHKPFLDQPCTCCCCAHKPFLDQPHSCCAHKPFLDQPHSCCAHKPFLDQPHSCRAHRPILHLSRS